VCDCLSFAHFFDHCKAVIPVDDALEFTDLVARHDQEESGLRAYRLVFGQPQFDRLGALGVAALTDEDHRSFEGGALRGLPDTLIDLAEENFVLRDPFRPAAGRDRLRPALDDEASAVEPHSRRLDAPAGQPALDCLQRGDNLPFAIVFEHDLHLAAAASDGDELGVQIFELVD
jgi:hypothetical protein